MENNNKKEELESPLISTTQQEIITDTQDKLVIRITKEEEGWRQVGLKIWEESKKLWHVAGPSIISRISSFSMNVVTTAFAGHLGDLELASLAIANTVIVGFNFGLLLGKLVLQNTSLDGWWLKKCCNCGGCVVCLQCLSNIGSRSIDKKFTRSSKVLNCAILRMHSMTINGWEMMIPLAFFAATGVRLANELGAGNGKAAKFATKVAVTTSTIIGLFFCVLIMELHDKFAFIFSDSAPVLEEVDRLSWLLAVTILLNSVQPVLSGVAIGSGWQAWVAYINIGCYYVVGLPLGVLMGWVFNTGVTGIWAGMIFGGTALQTLLLGIATVLCDWDKEAHKVVARVQKWSVAPQ